MVAACIKADTGVGPAMASGNQVYKGNWADLPIAPTNNNMVMATNNALLGAKVCACVATVPKSKLPK